MRRSGKYGKGKTSVVSTRTIYLDSRDPNGVGPTSRQGFNAQMNAPPGAEFRLSVVEVTIPPLNLVTPIHTIYLHAEGLAVTNKEQLRLAGAEDELQPSTIIAKIPIVDSTLRTQFRSNFKEAYQTSLPSPHLGSVELVLRTQDGIEIDRDDYTITPAAGLLGGNPWVGGVGAANPQVSFSCVLRVDAIRVRDEDEVGPSGPLDPKDSATKFLDGRKFSDGEGIRY